MAMISGINIAKTINTSNPAAKPLRINLQFRMVVFGGYNGSGHWHIIWFYIIEYTSIQIQNNFIKL